MVLIGPALILVLAIGLSHYQWFKSEGHRFNYSILDLSCTATILSLLIFMTLNALPYFHVNVSRFAFIQGSVFVIWAGAVSGMIMGRCFAISNHSGNYSPVSIAMGAVMGCIMGLLVYTLVYLGCIVVGITPAIY